MRKLKKLIQIDNEQTWKRFKIRCMKNDKTVKEVINEFIFYYAEEGRR